MNRSKKYSTWYPWFLLILCASLLFYKYVLNVSPSIMTQELMHEFHINAFGLGNLSATFFYTYTVAQIFSGVLLDRFGPRYLTGVCVGIAACGAFCFANSHALWSAVLARGMMGFGIAFATVTYLKITSTWFAAQRAAFADGLLATAVMLGAVFGQAPLSALLTATDWRFVLQLCGMIGGVIAVLFVVFIPSRTTQHNEHNSFSWKKIKQVLLNRHNWILTAYSGLAFAPLSMLGGLWGIPFMRATYDFSNTQCAGLISLLFVGFGVGGPICGFISDRIKKRICIMKSGVFLSLCAILIFLYIPKLSVLILSACLLGIGIGVGAFMLGFTVGTRNNACAVSAFVVALINTGNSFFESCTEPLIGALLDWHWSGKTVGGAHQFSAHDYHIAFSILPIYFVCAFVLLFWVRDHQSEPSCTV